MSPVQNTVTVVLTSPLSETKPLKKHFQQKGMNVICMPSFKIVQHHHHESLLLQQLIRLKATPQKAILCTSKRAVMRLLQVIKTHGHHQNLLDSWELLSIGKQTSQYITKQRLHLSKQANNPSQEGMVNLISKTPYQALLWPRAMHVRLVLPSHIKIHNLPCTSVILYETRPVNMHLTSLARHSPQAIVFGSSRSVETFFTQYNKQVHPPVLPLIVAVGPITAARVEQHGYRCCYPPHQTSFEAVSHLIQKLLSPSFGSAPSNEVKKKQSSHGEREETKK